MKKKKVIVPVVVTKELIAEAALLFWSSGDHSSMFEGLLAQGYRKGEVNQFFNEHQAKIETLADYLVDHIAEKVRFY